MALTLSKTWTDAIAAKHSPQAWNILTTSHILLTITAILLLMGCSHSEPNGPPTKGGPFFTPGDVQSTNIHVAFGAKEGVYRVKLGLIEYEMDADLLTHDSEALVFQMRELAKLSDRVVLCGHSDGAHTVPYLSVIICPTNEEIPIEFLLSLRDSAVGVGFHFVHIAGRNL